MIIDISTLKALQELQKQPTRGILGKRCSENMQQIYKRTLILKCDFIEITLRHGCSPVNCCIFSEHLFLGIILVGCLWNYNYIFVKWIKKVIVFCIEYFFCWCTEAKNFFSNYCWRSHLQMFFKIGVLRNFALFTRKHLCWSLFLSKLLRPDSLQL